MCDPVVAPFLLANAGTIGAGVLGLSALQQQRQALSQASDSQKQGQEAAAANSKATADAATAATNKAEAKQPNPLNLYADNQASAAQGVSGTKLTGPTGVDPKTLTLSRSSLLGA